MQFEKKRKAWAKFEIRRNVHAVAVEGQNIRETIRSFYSQVIREALSHRILSIQYIAIYRSFSSYLSVYSQFSSL